MQISFLCSFASSHVLFSWKVKGLTRSAPVATGLSFSTASVKADIANSLVLSGASSSPELWLSVSDLHPRVQSAVKVLLSVEAALRQGLMWLLQNLKVPFVWRVWELRKSNKYLKSSCHVINCIVCSHWNLCAHCCESRICCWRKISSSQQYAQKFRSVLYQHHRVQLYSTLINLFLFSGHPI